MQSVMLVVPGRKTDVSDAAWLCQLAEAGLLRASFVPPDMEAVLSRVQAAPTGGLAGGRAVRVGVGLGDDGRLRSV